MLPVLPLRYFVNYPIFLISVHNHPQLLILDIEEHDTFYLLAQSMFVRLLDRHNNQPTYPSAKASSKLACVKYRCFVLPSLMATSANSAVLFLTDRGVLMVDNDPDC